MKAKNRPMQGKWHEMNRKQRRQMIRKMQSEDLTLEMVHPDAAGVDIGNESHYVAVPPIRDLQPVRRFGCTTAELKTMADWLKQCGIQTVAMQSTGVYWIAVYDILEQAGLEVYLVNARETKNLPGRKSDVQESQTGTDLSQIDGIDATTAMAIISETGWDMSKWKTEGHFVSWLRLCPDNRISGDKIIGKGRLPTKNRATLALKMAASTLRISNTYLGAQFRRLRTRLGAPIAIKAMAAKLARLVYRMLRYGIRFVDHGAEFYEAQHRRQQIHYLKWKAAKLGLQITEAPAA
jgi:transposase